jgi:hypothetical protein
MPISIYQGEDQQPNCERLVSGRLHFFANGHVFMPARFASENVSMFDFSNTGE